MVIMLSIGVVRKHIFLLFCKGIYNCYKCGFCVMRISPRYLASWPQGSWVLPQYREVNT